MCPSHDIVQDIPVFLQGALNTLIYCVASFPIALALGLLLALMSNARFIWLRGPARIFIEVMRGTPLIAQIFIIYYAFGTILGTYGLANLDNYWTGGVAALALNYAAYEAEVFRAGFLSVDRGQGEAALSLGLTTGQSFFRIQLPQAVPFMIPPFVNDFIYMLKDSAIVSAISGGELTSVMNACVSRNGSNPLPFYGIAIVLYLALSLPTSFIAKYFENRLRAAL